MASAQILQLYYTKDNKCQKPNQTRHRHQHSQPLQQEKLSQTTSCNNFHILPQSNNILQQLSEVLYRRLFSIRKEQKGDIPAITNSSCWPEQQYNNFAFSKSIEQSTVHSAVSSEDGETCKDDDDIKEKVTAANGDYISTAKQRQQCSTWQHAFKLFKIKDRTQKADNTTSTNLATSSATTAYNNCKFSFAPTTDTCNVIHKNSRRNNICQTSVASATTKSKTAICQHHFHISSNNDSRNGLFQYEVHSSLPPQTSTPSKQSQSLQTAFSLSKFSKDNIKHNNNDIFNTSNLQPPTPAERTKAHSCEANKRNRDTATSTVNFILATGNEGEKYYAESKTPTTPTTYENETKITATCCQNNVPNNKAKPIAVGIDKTCFLQERIDFNKDDIINGTCSLCKFKPNTCQMSKSPQCCITPTTMVQCKPRCTNSYENEQIQSSIIAQRENNITLSSSRALLQSNASGSTTSPEEGNSSSISSNHKLQCRHQTQQHQQQIRQQRMAKFYNFDCHKCCNGHLHSPYTNHNTTKINNTNKITLSKQGLLPTTTRSSAPNRKVCKRLSENVINAFTDVQRFTRTILPIVIIFNILPLLYAECDQTFVSRVGGPQNGTFSAPVIHNQQNHSRQCLYIFLAGPGQRVEVIFTTFNLRGSPPDGSAVGELPTCVHEYMDIYSEVQSSDPADLINSPFGGRFCGTIPPRQRISMHRAIAISFFTNKYITEPDLFEGRYRFLNASEYEIGIPIAGSPCSYTITPSMSINKTGALVSPTYPGAYPKDMSCTYQFLGETNQRIRLEFRDFDLFFGGPHCPFDYVKVYDGPDNSSSLIGTYCGQQRNLVIYSSESSLFVHFYTLPRTANTQNRGFKGIYEFSESFVKLDFIRENDGIHIRGTECDQKILSKKESTGFVLSPNYPYPYIQKTVCRYFIYGMQDAQHLERVRLEFSAFNIPKVEMKDKSESNCSDGYLKIYLKGQETADAYDKFDYELCGNETQKVVSDGPRLAMVFSSGELQGRGFKGKYTFETEYKIPGTAAPDGTCSFTYVSSSKKRGELNSPRYPSNYPSETNCTYLFLAEPNEQVTIVFDHFKVKADNINATAGAYGASACFEDWLEMYVIYRDNNDRFLGRYCGLTAPGPVESPKGAVGIRITLHTDQENVASGFKARYYFEPVKMEFGDCGGNFSNEDSGIITSPYYPSNYKSPAKGMPSMACNWYIAARAGYKLSINFEHFAVEGDPMARGCPAAVLRMWINVDSEAPPIELCSEKPPTEHWHYITTGQSARISFTTTDKTIGAQGFRIVWTEIQDSGPGPPAIGLLCESTYHFQCNVGYCISDKLRCDGVKNCGPGDDSDEMHCITEAPKEDHGILIIVSMAAVSFLICLLCTLCHRQKKRRHRQLGLHRNTGHYDSTTSAMGLGSSRRQLQSGGSLSGSLHGINSGNLVIPPAPLPPSVPPPPHVCIDGLAGRHIGCEFMIDGGLNDEDDNDDDEDNGDIFINDLRFDDNGIDHLETV